MFSEHLFTELLLITVSDSLHNLVLLIVIYTFDFLFNADIPLPLVLSLDNFYEDISNLSKITKT